MSFNNHLGLPEEVFLIILQHLDLIDVLSCSLVCLGWRNAVNSDHIWKMLCKKNISGERLKLRTERKRVGSSYGVFESVNLPRLCFWRTRYMDDIDLKRNWKNGCFQEDFIIDFNDDSYQISFRENKWETDNELLLVPKSLYNSPSPYTVFNIVDNPIKTGEIHLAMGNHVSELFKLTNNILVIVQCTLLQVYAKDEDKNLKLKFFGLFDRNHSETIPDTQDLSNWYAQIGYPSDARVQCDHNGKYFIGMYSRNNAGVLWCSPLHIWDLESQTKVQEVDFPWQMPGEPLKFVASLSLLDNVMHIILKYQSCISIYSCDIGKSTYSKTVLELGGDLKSILFSGTVALMSSLQGNKLLLFDWRDGRKLETVRNSCPIVTYSVEVFGKLIIYAEYSEDPPTMIVYDKEKMCLIDQFLVEWKNVSVSWIHVVMDDLMIIGTYYHLLLRDPKTREILRTDEGLDFLPPDPSCSKMVVLKPGGELVLRHFW